MLNHYQTLGLTSAATTQEIRRAYRILARRYHPDLNPGAKNTARFREIARAYEVLSDPKLRRQHDHEIDGGVSGGGTRGAASEFSSSFDRAHATYRASQEAAARRSQRPRSASGTADSAQAANANTTATPDDTSPGSPPPPRGGGALHLQQLHLQQLRRALGSLKELTRRGSIRFTAATRWGFNHLRLPLRRRGAAVSQLSVIEVSVSIREAVRGVRRAVEVAEEGSPPRRISVSIPPGVRSGSVVRLRHKGNQSEELVVIVRVAPDPWVSISHKGLTIEVPITVTEAVQGARIQVPTLDEPTLVSVEPGTQSGTEVRLRERGITYRDGTRGDLFVRFMIRVPETPGVVGLREVASALSPYYEHPVRRHLPKQI